MAEQFLTQAEDQRFKDWMAQHPNGFYLNEVQVGNIKRKSGGTILHKVSCPHLGNGEGVISTTYAKATSEAPKELLDWAGDSNLTVVTCSTCKPY